jgi:hypothetical protein
MLAREEVLARTAYAMPAVLIAQIAAKDLPDVELQNWIGWLEEQQKVIVSGGR